MTGGSGGELWRWQHARAEAPSLELEPAAFSDIPGWQEDDHAAAFACYMQTAGQSGQPFPPAGHQVNPRAFFEENFLPFRIPAKLGLLTAYFEPVLAGSRKRSAAFPVPVYRRPADLVPLPGGHPLTSSGLTAARHMPFGLDPYFTRGEIEAGALDGQGLEVLYLADPLEAFVMHVQGSGCIEFEDGSSLRLTFDGKNGHPYTSISKLLVARGVLSLEEAYLDGLLSWLRAYPHPEIYLNENKSYIFFRELLTHEKGPKGSCGAALTPGRSLAADPLYYPVGTPIWVDARKPVIEGGQFRRLCVAQDTGSAIVGPQRGDIFAGCGPKAGEVAGCMRHECSFIVLKPKR